MPDLGKSTWLNNLNSRCMYLFVLELLILATAVFEVKKVKTHSPEVPRSWLFYSKENQIVLSSTFSQVKNDMTLSQEVTRVPSPVTQGSVSSFRERMTVAVVYCTGICCCTFSNCTLIRWKDMWKLAVMSFTVLFLFC